MFPPKPLAGGLLAIHGVIPQGFHRRAVEPLLQAAQALQGFPALFLGYLIGSRKQLGIGIHGHPTALQRHNHLQELVGHLQGRRIAQLAAHHATIAVLLPSLQPRLQARQRAGQSVTVALTEFLRTVEDQLPHAAHRGVQTAS